MKNAVDDNLSHPMINRLAALRDGGHAQEDLRALLARIGLLDVQTAIEGSDHVSTMVLPSSLARLVCTEYPREFILRFGAKVDKVRQFWEAFLSRPKTKAWASRHPFLRDKTVGDLVTTIPCALRIDAGPCTKSLSTNCISWSTLLGEGEEKLTKWLICSYLKKDNTADANVYWDIVGDFDKMATGLVGGQPIAKTGRQVWRFVLLILKGGEDQRANELG
eukprot:6523673-Pyramimonas_sp.AAC.1